MCTKILQWRLAGVVILALAVALPAAAAGPALKIRGVSVKTQTLAKAVERPDAQGQRRAFSAVAVVEIQGDFPPAMDQSLDLFIGEFPISEYGTTPNGIYFKVYDPALLTRLGGQEIRYRVGRGAIRGTGSRFSPPAARQAE